MFDSIHEECGVFGIFDRDQLELAPLVYYGLFSLQHRGQESCGIAVNDDGTINCHKAMGLVSDVFTPDKLDKLKGSIAIGHVRYSTTGASTAENAQPLVTSYVKGTLSIAHNGNLTNCISLKSKLEDQGAIFHTSVDYLIGLTDIDSPETLVVSKSNEPDLFEIVSSYKKLDDSQKKRLLAYASRLGLN